MTDQTMTFAAAKAAVGAFARERDWEQFHAPKNLSMAIAVEAAELMEHFLWDTTKASAKRATSSYKKRAIAEELADVFLFALQFANMTKIDIATAVRTKLAKNAGRYPVHKAKGRAEKYTEL